MHWANPGLLWLFWAVTAALALLEVWAMRKRRFFLALLGDSALVEQLADSRDLSRRRQKSICLIAAAGLIVIALARPQVGGSLAMQTRRGIDVIVALDVSHSMLAEDLSPTRLDAAKREIAGLIKRLRGDRVGLVIFAGEAFIQCPLTLDYEAVLMFLDEVDVSAIPIPGTAIAKAIRTATEAFVKEERKHKVLVLLTDGEDHLGNPVKAAEQASEAGVVIYAIGLGSLEGAPIPVRDESGGIRGHLKASDGSIVLSRLDEDTLARAALAAGGAYLRASAGQLELDGLADRIAGMEEKTLADRLYMQYEERFQFPAGLALLLLLVDWSLTDRRFKVCGKRKDPDKNA